MPGSEGNGLGTGCPSPSVERTQTKQGQIVCFCQKDGKGQCAASLFQRCKNVKGKNSDESCCGCGSCDKMCENF
eukprot:COSAG05_NODE_14582_length_393_cov_0.486395_1_plen_73_part_10